MVYNWVDVIRNTLFPSQCRVCLAPGVQNQDLCTGCRELSGEVSDRCPSCLKSPPALDACHALFAYQPPTDGWIHALKFHQDLAIARLLGELLAEHPAIVGRADQLKIVPVPLHPLRRAQRGYNQAQELARPLLKTGYAAARYDCRRARHTTAQSTLDKKQRNRNLHGVFSVKTSQESQQLLLVDDVMTTGATLNALATELKRAGAGRVEALVVARTIVRT